MSDLRELYQQVILDHNKTPRNFRKIESAHREADGHNPLCGDDVTIFVHLEGDVIADVSFQGQGCAISKASSSLMTETLKGKTVQQFRELFEEFHEMVTAKPGEHPTPSEKLGKLAVLGGVSEFPMRVKCATLSWHTLQAALDQSEETVTTEWPSMDKAQLEAAIVKALRTVYDPEIPVNLYEMGMIYEIEIGDSADVVIRMTLTSPACPVAESLPAEVHDRVAQVEGVNGVDVELVWDPPWTPDRMSEAARLQLGMM